MADLQHDYANWAARKAGKDEEAYGEQPGGQEDGQGEQEPPPPPQECVRHAAEELGEAIDQLEKAKGQVDDSDAIQKVIDELTVQQQTLTEQAEELEQAASEEEDDEDDDEEERNTPEPEAV